jgi:MFS transporter, MHS family, proline/betaine transporter
MKSPKHRMTPQTVFAATSGNVIEWYDFTVYSFLAPIIATQFFPSDNQVVSLLSAFAVLAAGYLARPLGSVIFGFIGDKIGRKPAMMWSITMMGVGSLLISLLPAFAQIGVLAPILLVLIRVIQGISVAGEYATSGVLLVEQAEPKSRGFVGGWIAFAMMLGCVAGSGVPALLGTFLTEIQLESWGWRIPFFIGSLAALYSLVLRRHISETEIAGEETETHRSPIIAAIRGHWKLMLQMVILLIPAAVIYFTIFVYAASYLTDELHFSTAQALNITTLNLILIAVIAVFVGWLSDRIGRMPLFLIGAIGTLVMGWPLWWLMHQDSIYLVFLGQFGFSAFNAIGWGLSITVLVEMAPPRLRCSTVAMGYNLSMALFGGTTPLVATYMVSRTGNDFTPVYYIMAATLISLMVIVRIPKLTGQSKQSSATL